MGCCLSSPSPPHNDDVSTAPPPPVDKETVKEVLSETPILQDPVFHVQPDPDPTPKIKRPVYGEIPQEELSEICSSLRSESVAADNDDDDVMHNHQKVVSSTRVSPRKLLKSPRDGYGPGRVVGSSPTRRMESSPGRRYGYGVGPSRRVGFRSDPSMRRDPGESSGRRSRSPATRATDDSGGVYRGNVSRSPSANRRNPGRVMGERSNSLTRRRGEEPKPDEDKWAGPDESFDNPLVSLECFIFL